MKSKVSFLALVSAILLSGCGRSNQNDPLPADGDRGTTKKTSAWNILSSPEGRFSVLMPGAPQTHKQNIQTPLGALALKIFLVEGRNTGYAVSYGDYPKDLIENSGPDNILDGACAGTAASRKGRIVSKKKITLDEHPGREYLLATPQGGYRARIYLVGERLYQNIVTGPATSSQEADKFLDSFRLVNE